MKKIITTTLFVCLIGTAGASEQVFTFKNPSFSGSGYSNHVLSIEQLQFNRKKEAEEKAAADAAKAKREADSTTLAKFLNNIESRIYAQLSKQLVDNMFGTSCTSNCATSGTAEVEGSQIYWVKDSSTDVITLTITDTTGTVSTMSVPVGDFIF